MVRRVLLLVPAAILGEEDRAVNSRAMSTTWGVLLGWTLSALASSGSSAQPRDPDVQTSEDIPIGQAVVVGDFVPSVRALAQLLLDNFDLVAVGMFDSPPDEGNDLNDVLKPHDLTIAFRILMLYKGPSAQDGVVHVKLNSGAGGMVAHHF